MLRRRRIVLFTAAISLGLASLAAAQQEGAKGVVAVRQATMDANAKHMNAIKAILSEDPQLIKLVELARDAGDRPAARTLLQDFDAHFPNDAARGSIERLLQQLAR